MTSVVRGIACQQPTVPLAVPTVSSYPLRDNKQADRHRADPANPITRNAILNPDKAGGNSDSSEGWEIVIALVFVHGQVEINNGRCRQAEKRYTEKTQLRACPLSKKDGEYQPEQ
jgi:hypothetical protein